jgi:hypothetical protein
MVEAGLTSKRYAWIGPVVKATRGILFCERYLLLLFSAGGLGVKSNFGVPVAVPYAVRYSFDVETAYAH